MAFTYTEDLTVARDFVRFHSGDTVEAESLLSDALITSLIAVEGTQQKAVLAAIRYKMMRFSQPDFRADWLQVSNSTAVKSLERLLSEKRTEFGIPRFTASVTHVYRVDSDQTEEPTYQDDLLSED